MKTCTKCGNIITKPKKRSSRCNDCRTAAHKEYCDRVGYHKKYYARNAESERERHLIKKYGVSLAEYKQMFDAQEGACAVCEKKQAHPFNVDHCHKTGAVRGLLCTNCNRMLGHAHDDVQRLVKGAEYLLSRKSRQNLSKPTTR